MDIRQLLSANVLGLIAAMALAVTTISQGARWGRAGVTTAGARPSQATEQPPTLMPGDVRVSGRVTDRDSGKPIAGASVMSYNDLRVGWPLKGPDSR